MAKHDPEQQENLDRVSSEIADAIMNFALERLTSVQQGKSTFYMSELLGHINGIGIAVAPDSPGRILRSLRQRKLLDYKVINRRASLYEVTSVNLASDGNGNLVVATTGGA